MKHIDPHVHCRDGRESHKMTIRRVSEMAKEQGIIAICDMPNTKPPILYEPDVIDRLTLAEKTQPMAEYYLYVGLTTQEEQIRGAVQIVRKYPKVVGLKLYTVKSRGLGVPAEKDQRKIYRILAEEGYLGVLAVHCEKEKLFQRGLFYHHDSRKHNLVRPEEAEIESLEDQIMFAIEERFAGTLYICHITLPESAKLIWQAKKYLSIFSEVTPHHLLWSFEDSSNLVNPPLRSREAVRGLLRALNEGIVDCLGTDFAPNPKHLPGIASYQLYGQALDFLWEQGITEERINDLTYWNIKKVFGEKLKNV